MLELDLLWRTSKKQGSTTFAGSMYWMRQKQTVLCNLQVANVYLKQSIVTHCNCTPTWPPRHTPQTRDCVTATLYIHVRIQPVRILGKSTRLAEVCLQNLPSHPTMAVPASNDESFHRERTCSESSQAVYWCINFWIRLAIVNPVSASNVTQEENPNGRRAPVSPGQKGEEN